MSCLERPLSSYILLVEDNTTLCKCLKQFIQDQGYQAIVAGTLKEGLERLGEYRPWLCLLDLNLPDGSGLELLNRVTSNGHRCRVIVMTAFDLKHLRPAHAAGVLAGWMNKPVDPVELMRLVKAEEIRQSDIIAGADRSCSR
ncbi:MAG: response regulator [Tepidisphaeraceae bacterium]|jgi:DNA-binding response OmpR family regulator